MNFLWVMWRSLRPRSTDHYGDFKLSHYPTVRHNWLDNPNLVTKLNKRERVKLLAATYLDACVATQTTASLQTKFLVDRVFNLWNDGSYWEFERAMDTLRATDRKQNEWFWRSYVLRFTLGYNTTLPPGMAPHKRHAAEQGLSFIVERVDKRCDGNIYVPSEVSHWAGFGTSAKEATRPRFAKRAA